MEHLDLAGYLNTPVTWNLGAFEQQDAIYLSSSRQMLEPIMEETSEDEEHAQNSWNGCEQRGSCGGFWSSAESETGSVIRVEVNKDIDAISERDFACPPKRARRSQDEQLQQLQSQLQSQQPHSLEDVVQLRHRPPPPRYDADAHNSLERFLALEACARDSYGSQGQRSSTGSRRGGFEEFYSDNDSYHSLSRSSSLVQFESLERQMTLQEQHQSMSTAAQEEEEEEEEEGGSHSNPDSRRGSATSLLKRYESSDGRLHQTYYELHKLDFEEQQRELFGACKSLHQAELKSDSESSSTSSSDSSGHSMLSACPGKQSSDGAGGIRRLPLNSAENLSEDSGYCEPSTLRRAKSKSIPKNFDKLCEEEEMMLEQHHDVVVVGAGMHSKNSNDLSARETAHTRPADQQHPHRLHRRRHRRLPPRSLGCATVCPTYASREVRLPIFKRTTTATCWPTTTTSSSSSSSSSANCSPVLANNSNNNSNTITSSVPNELQQLGRRRRARPRSNRSERNCQSSDGHSSSEDLDNFDCCSLPRIRRSCSWNDRCGWSGASASSAAAAGYLNASYQNLTLLDYTDQSENCKRSALNMDRRNKQPREDYEHLICKGNFLLDELSQIYDKNASILNDKTMEEVEEEEQRPAAKSVQDLIEEPPQVQHVQLTIRKPPARQKHKELMVLSQEVATPTVAAAPAPTVISFSSFGKTFDQDPTNLRTSYAQSLEQCNIEVASDNRATAAPVRVLPKRRFQSTTAKQRSLVSSTPNLSAFDGGGQETEDDIYVSSAHNSMHQLPQTTTQPKPLGILLPAGSRNSFSKEVSFCPVVSKYCWQEQSSEEPQEEQQTSEDEEQEQDEEEEEELLDNNDATVIYNTKENENIAVRYNEEQQLRATQQQQREQESVVVSAIEERSAESDENNENIASMETRQQQQQQQQTKTSPTSLSTSLPSPPVSVSVPSVAAAVSLETRVDASSSTTNVAPSSVAISLPVTVAVSAHSQRPLSLHLPILSEPPTNRAHHILYASQQLLQRYDTDPDHDHGHVHDHDNMSKSQSMNAAISHSSGNNNESPQKQRANKSDEKHPSSKSFLSRFAHGLRFSLRRKKKQQQQQQQQIEQKPVTTTKTVKQQSNGKSQDIIHIPLKPPRSGMLDESNISEASTASMHSRQTATTATTTTAATTAELPKTSTLQKLVTGKPPLPKQPARQAHALSSPAASAAHAAHAAAVGSAAHASNALLDAEREQYAAFAKQLTSGHRQTPTTMRDMSETVGTVTGTVTGTESPSRATVAQKTQMFNQLGAATNFNSNPARPLTMVTAVPVAVSPMLDDNNKMGLIETNLDTHETVISGKTRSLMDITCNPMHLPHKRYLVKRLNVTSAAYDVEHDDDDDDDDDVDANGQRIKTSTQAGGVQIASVRRPHKSMEFLLDKENQKNVLY
ncbi:hypothetical protein ACLKA6_013732 [Drosophila palustris]